MKEEIVFIYCPGWMWVEELAWRRGEKMLCGISWVNIVHDEGGR